MSTANQPSPEEEGVRAFLAMSESMEHMSRTLSRVEATQKSLVSNQELAATRIADAAKDAEKAAGTALEAATAAQWPVAAWSVLGALLGLLAGILGAYYVGSSKGWHAGRADGYAQARDEQAAVHWASSPGGRTARALEGAGSLTALATCSAPGWRIVTHEGRRVCSPLAAQGNTYGWFLP